MRLEDITVAVRPRTGWDAIDLGLRMYQQWWRNLFLPWLAFVIPLMFLVVVVLHDNWFLCMLVLWWLKPIYSRFALFVFSQNLFSETPRVPNAYQTMLTLYLKHVVKLLTIYRLDPARSFNLPVWQLEGLKGRARRERARVLQQRSYNPAVNLTLLSLVFEVAVFMSLIGLFYMFMPLSGALITGTPTEETLPSWTASLLFIGAQILTYTLIEPIYAAGGFSLYINRRTVLEAWDLELAFRRTANRLKQEFGAKVAMLAFAAGLLTGVGPPPVMAGTALETTQTPISRSHAEQLVQEILADPVFGETKQVKGWYPKQSPEQDEDEASSPWWEFLAPLMQFIARLIGVLGQAILWILVAIGVVFLIILAARYGPALPLSRVSRRSRRAAPTTLFGMSVTPESLPQDVAGHARRLVNEGELRRAMSLLYRASLSRLVNDYGVPLSDSATEGDCVRLVQSGSSSLPAATRGFFEQLTALWQFTAYARGKPAPQELLSVCEAWPRHFERQA